MFNPHQSAGLIELLLKDSRENGALENAFRAAIQCQKVSASDLKKISNACEAVLFEVTGSGVFTPDYFVNKDKHFVWMLIPKIKLQLSKVKSEGKSFFRAQLNEARALLQCVNFKLTDKFMSEVVGCSLSAVKRWKKQGANHA